LALIGKCHQLGGLSRVASSPPSPGNPLRIRNARKLTTKNPCGCVLTQHVFKLGKLPQEFMAAKKSLIEKIFKPRVLKSLIKMPKSMQQYIEYLNNV